MAKYRVWAESISYVYVDIEAKSEDAAYDYVKNYVDGGDFHEEDGDWEMGAVMELDDDADVDFVVSEKEEE